MISISLTAAVQEPNLGDLFSRLERAGERWLDALRTERQLVARYADQPTERNREQLAQARERVDHAERVFRELH